MNCDLKTSSKAWNDGIDAFKKAFKLSGGNTTTSIKFALTEIQRLHPDLDFSHESFIDPLVKSLKEKEVINKDYEFSTKNKTKVSEKKVDEIVEKAKGLDENQKKTFAKKVYEQLNESEMLSHEKIQSLYSEAIGLPSMNEKMRELVRTVATNNKALDAVNKEIKTLLGEAQTEKAANDGKLTPERDAHFEKSINALNEKKKKAELAARDSAHELANNLQEKGFWMKDIADMARMNLMNPVSLLKNFTGAIGDGALRQVSNATSSVMSEILYHVFNQRRTNPILARTKGALATKKWQSVKEAWKYGAIDKTKTDLPSGSSLSSSNEFRRAMDATGYNKLKHYVAGAFKYSPERIAKTLAATDAIFFDMAYNAELERVASSQGLKGFDKAAFMENPDDNSKELAKTYAEKVTFRQDMPYGIKTSFSFEEGKKWLMKGKNPLGPTAASYISGLTYMANTLIFPFIKTPINIVRNALTIMMPELTISKGIFDAYREKNGNEKQRILTEATAKAITGMVIRSVAMEMLSAGLISAGYSDEDEKTKDVIEQQAGGPNRININALMRGLTFGEVKAEPGDRFVDLSSLGVLGIVFGAYAHAYTKFSKEELNQEKDIIKNEFSILPRVAGGVLGSAMDQTFFTGINELQRAVKEIDGGGMSKYLINNMMTLFGSIIPSTMQKFSTSSDPFVYKQFDKSKDFGENLSNALGYRFAGSTGTMDKKYFSLSEDPNSSLKRKDYLLLDSYLGRLMQQELDVFKAESVENDNPISRLYEATRDVAKDDRSKLLPSSVGKTQNFDGVKLQMSGDQYNYLADRAAIHRTLRATPYIMSEDFKKSNYEERVDVLKSFYKDGLEAAKEDLIQKYPELLNGDQGTGEDDDIKTNEMIEKYKPE